MNIVMRILYATSDFVIINILAYPMVADPLALIWYALCVALAFALRLGMEHKKKMLTKQTLLYQSICTISWCFFAVLIWNDFLVYERGFEIYLFLNSLFAVFLIGQLENVFEMGVKEWLKIKLRKFLAVEEKEEAKP